MPPPAKPKKDETKPKEVVAASTVSNDVVAPANTVLQSGDLPLPPASESESASKAKQKKAMLEAADEYKTLMKELGTHEAVTAFLGSSIAPAKPEKEKKSDPSEAAKEAEKMRKDLKIDNTLKDRSKDELGLPDRPTGFGAKYLTEDWKIKGIAKVDDPTKLDAQSWKVIGIANGIFHGFYVRKNGTLTRARFPAFELKPAEDAATANSINYISHFEVFDESSVTVKETHTELERSMASNSFSSVAIAASLSGGGFGYSAAAAFGYDKDSATKSNKGEFADRREYTATYSQSLSKDGIDQIQFPRARIFVDEYNLRFTRSCAAELVDVRSAMQEVVKHLTEQGKPDESDAVKKAIQARDKFFSKFGHIFATNFQLGGQLFASRSASSTGGTSEDEQRDAMKMSAALSFASPYVSGSVSASNETSDALRTKTASIKDVSALSWSARGGNTLLCADPPEWANSLAASNTWRVIEREAIYSLPDLIAKIITSNSLDEWQDVPDLFKILESQIYNTIPAVPKGTWNHRISLELLDGRKLGYNYQAPSVDAYPASIQSVPVILTVLDADITRRKEVLPVLPELYADHPIFLSPSQTPTRQIQDVGGQFEGLCVGRDGRLSLPRDSTADSHVCRWSLRPAKTVIDHVNRWKPGSTVIRDGDEVMLYCHSFGPGAFRTKSDAPYFAPTLYRRSGTESTTREALFVPALTFSTLCKPTLISKSSTDGTPLTQDNLRGWRAIFDQSSPKLKPVMEERDVLMQTIRDYDRGLSSPERDAGLELLRKILGLKDSDNRARLLLSIFKRGPDSVLLDKGSLVALERLSGKKMKEYHLSDSVTITAPTYEPDIEAEKSEEVDMSSPQESEEQKLQRAIAYNHDSFEAAIDRVYQQWDAAIQDWRSQARYEKEPVDQQVTFRVRYL